MIDQHQIDFAPRTGSGRQWNDAYARLADYFRAHRIHSRLHRTFLILETLNSTDAPLGMLRAMRPPIQRSAPDLSVSSMVPLPIDLGSLPELAEETSGFPGRHPWMRYFILSLLAALAAWGLWTVTR